MIEHDYLSDDARAVEFRQRFLARVRRQENGCWPWPGCSIKGYGLVIWFYKRYRAHRVAWEIENKMHVPDGLSVLHSCDNPPCCNPAHLRAGVQAENMKDMVVRGRSCLGERNGQRTCPERRPRGEMNGQARLSAEDVRKIRSRRQTGETLQSIASDFNVDRKTVHRIVRGETWRDSQ